MSALEVTFVTADRTVWTGQAAQVVVPAIDGSMGILPQMQPTLAILGDGVIRIHDLDGHVDERSVSGGFVSVDSDVVTIGVDDAEVVAPRSNRSECGLPGMTDQASILLVGSGCSSSWRRWCCASCWARAAHSSARCSGAGSWEEPGGTG